MNDLPEIHVVKNGSVVKRELVIDGRKIRDMSKPEIIAVIQQFASSLRDY